jgi:hypothetical protein
VYIPRLNRPENLLNEMVIVKHKLKNDKSSVGSIFKEKRMIN